MFKLFVIFLFDICNDLIGFILFIEFINESAINTLIPCQNADTAWTLCDLSLWYLQCFTRIYSPYQVKLLTSIYTAFSLYRNATLFFFVCISFVTCHYTRFSFRLSWLEFHWKTFHISVNMKLNWFWFDGEQEQKEEQEQEWRVSADWSAVEFYGIQLSPRNDW